MLYRPCCPTKSDMKPPSVRHAVRNKSDVIPAPTLRKEDGPRKKTAPLSARVRCGAHTQWSRERELPTSAQQPERVRVSRAGRRFSGASERGFREKEGVEFVTLREPVGWGFGSGYGFYKGDVSDYSEGMKSSIRTVPIS